ncbi:Diphthine--ammonia ligase [Cyphellophora attinorum]|uniref:Diphthine--ammonia ligase n=1 Tax=Cyphellophora attinorum TaxID=1664694 RepID=A0A0N1H8V1_9EURO|nr:Diphthine--ammonia ligase [Phialophora attinorum]KPI39705.1 Diphthine--ammonia ligase [Phialophora attinorum]
MQQDYQPPDQLERLTGSDEAEDLLSLLNTVKQAIPAANAVSSGAILSTYQRTRVESVVLRMGMTPLAYLWQYPFLPPPPERNDSSTGLLDDMLAAGCDAILVKSASYGIPPTLLSRSLGNAGTIIAIGHGFRNRNLFIEDEAEYRASVLGEGGEYETLTVNGPRSLWRKKINWRPSQTWGDGDATLELDNAPEVVAQDPEDQHLEQPLRIPAEFDVSFAAIVNQCRQHSVDEVAGRSRPHPLQADETSQAFGDQLLQHTMAFSTHHVAVTNITAALRPSLMEEGATDHILGGSASLGAMSAAQQMQQISLVVKSFLQMFSRLLGLYESITVRNVTSTMLLLASMDDFSSVNVHYAELFSSINPPARCTFATALQSDVKVSLSIVIDLRHADARRSLHVQSRSYWAPANIGPYSQAVAERLSSIGFDDDPASRAELVNFAGQIPLRPITMELAFEDELQNIALSLQHLWRVGQEREVDLWMWGLALLAGSANFAQAAQQAFDIWYRRHSAPTGLEDGNEDQDEEVDVWDLVQNRTRYDGRGATYRAPANAHLHTLPNWQSLDGSKKAVPPFVAAEVSQLPRSVPIEWWSIGLGRLPKGPKACARQRECKICTGETSDIVHRTLQYIHGEEGCFVSVFVRLNSPSAAREYHDVLSRLFQHTHDAGRKVVSGHCLLNGSVGAQYYSRIANKPWMRGIAVVPCHDLYFGCAPSQSDENADADNKLEAAALVFLVRTEESLDGNSWGLPSLTSLEASYMTALNNGQATSFDSPGITPRVSDLRSTSSGSMEGSE